MNPDQVNKMCEALASGTDRLLELSYGENTITLKKSSTKAEYVWWLMLILGVPIYCLLTNPSIKTFIIVIFLAAAFIYLVYDGLLTTNKVEINLTLKEISITTNDKILAKIGLLKNRKIGFANIEAISLGEKSFGRVRPPGRRLFIETTTGDIIIAMDFSEISNAEMFYHILKDILK